MALDYFQDGGLDFYVVSAHSSLQTFQIVQRCRNNTKAVILTAQCYLICVRSNKIILLCIVVLGFPFFPKMQFAALQKLCSKCTEIKN